MAFQGVSRRGFIQKAAAVAAGFAGASLLGSCSTEDAAKDAGVQWDREADIVIVGAGAAGLWGAIRATNEGLVPLVLEKAPEEQAGGDCRVSGGYLMTAATNPRILLDTGSFREANEELVYSIDTEGLAAIDYIIDNGYATWNGGLEYVQVDGAGPGVYKALLQAAKDVGVEVLYSTPALSLITGEGNEVLGVKAGSEDAPINVKGRRATLLACGSYTMDEELMANFHFPGFKYYSIGTPYATGDGLKMAGVLGAKLSKISKGYEIMYLTSVAASEAVGTGVMCVPPANNSVIIVNQDGNRFIDEYTSFTHNKETLSLFAFEGDMMECRANNAFYTNRRMFEIVDAETFATCNLGNVNAGCGWANLMPESEGGYIWSEDNSQELEKGWILKGDTLDDIASQIEVDPVALKATVDEYNAACESGEDKFRMPVKLAPLGDGPYYAIELCTSFIYTIGGLTNDERGRTINWNNEPIPRLYHAGDVGETVTYLQPTAINGAWGQASVAINDIMHLAPWDLTQK
ncbi:FAD-binding protein [Slackia heliotrinireducens]|uniref:FAD-binding protein n=1 Tax=Slackia heliotrinireducens TaxID=84110 RepID=UPI0033161098